MARTEVIFSRLDKEEAEEIKKVCAALDDTPARIFRKLLLDWLRKNKKKVNNSH